MKGLTTGGGQTQAYNLPQIGKKNYNSTQYYVDSYQQSHFSGFSKHGGGGVGSVDLSQYTKNQIIQGQTPMQHRPYPVDHQQWHGIAQNMASINSSSHGANGTGQNGTQSQFPGFADLQVSQYNSPLVSVPQANQGLLNKTKRGNLRSPQGGSPPTQQGSPTNNASTAVADMSMNSSAIIEDVSQFKASFQKKKIVEKPKKKITVVNHQRLMHLEGSKIVKKVDESIKNDTNTEFMSQHSIQTAEQLMKNIQQQLPVQKQYNDDPSSSVNDVISKAFPERRALSLAKKRTDFSSPKNQSLTNNDIANDDYLPQQQQQQDNKQIGKQLKKRQFNSISPSQKNSQLSQNDQRSKSHITRDQSELEHEKVSQLQTKISLIDKLLGNTSEGKELKDKFFQMILTPSENFDQKKALVAKPYLHQIMKPGKFYQDQAVRSPRLIEKDIKVEQVHSQRISLDDNFTNSVSAYGFSKSPSSKMIMHSIPSQNQILNQADLMHHEYLTRLIEQTFGYEEQSKQLPTRMNFQVAPSIKNLNGGPSSSNNNKSFIKPVQCDNLNATAPLILNQKHLVHDPNDYISAVQPSNKNNSNNFTSNSKLSSMQTLVVHHSSQSPSQKTINYQGGSGNNQPTIKFSNLSTHLKHDLYQEIQKKIDVEDLEERMKVRKLSRFINDTTYQCLSQLKKKIKEQKQSQQKSPKHNQQSHKGFHKIEAINHTLQDAYNQSSAYLKGLDGSSPNHGLNTSRSRLKMTSDHDLAMYLQGQQLKNEQYLLKKSQSSSVGIEVEMPENNNNNDLTHPAEIHSPVTQRMSQKQIMHSVQSELSDDISLKVQRQMIAMNQLSEAQQNQLIIQASQRYLETQKNYINVIESGNQLNVTNQKPALKSKEKSPKVKKNHQSWRKLNITTSEFVYPPSLLIDNLPTLEPKYKNIMPTVNVKQQQAPKSKSLVKKGGMSIPTELVNPFNAGKTMAAAIPSNAQSIRSSSVNNHNQTQQSPQSQNSSIIDNQTIILPPLMNMQNPTIIPVVSRYNTNEEGGVQLQDTINGAGGGSFYSGFNPESEQGLIQTNIDKQLYLQAIYANQQLIQAQMNQQKAVGTSSRKVIPHKQYKLGINNNSFNDTNATNNNGGGGTLQNATLNDPYIKAHQNEKLKKDLPKGVLNYKPL